MSRTVQVIGIGPGSPAHVTAQAAAAMASCDVFLVADKGEAKDELVAVRRGLCEALLEPGTYRVVTVPDPERGPDARRDAAAYRAGVDAWHAERARRYAAVVDALPEDAVVGFLVWGDPAFYDSTLRIVRAVGRLTPVTVHVVPGISALQVLAAEHGIVLNGIGGPVHVTTGRRLLQEWRPDLGTVVVMLDARLRCVELLERAPDLVVHWGAYLGLPQQELRAGRLADLAEELVALRLDLRARHGWVMDTYALSLPEDDARAVSGTRG
ncbi:precorrin-6A synthase (deacetylating) [Phycicoccus endophyticus]|uniref:Precorrin-6A synthase (Deacetylating) n=1 Tax=Phycicoccus endophyticus TaxID=1690220 RepID=A0A7G9R3N0_9MICO|nr:precorrin-6A synthase (deacetylating) [Phycicoccus endophyticus]NHI18022.1 precorrin-6A synthase (deacetylating) [Phycicoccus endophyticus]QNN50205.1 precorrin-6A synthase (deacetylating) [Phycicoccus endophyticus]GGL27032.1 putative tetrapyrrole methylase family protein [Phycicoccus endophyticus]